ncbi:MAG: class I SAM-dependent methyltransferase [Candidatus Tectomicrobia bacterium]|nr:class I SAM-dependent methyltransferase [Candidatus Tectomicrobia bacterium]
MSTEEHSSQEGVVGVFSRAASTYDSYGPRFFAQLGQRLVEVSHITPGAHVLDVATGRGAVLFAAEAQVGPDGHAVGIDLAENMVRETTAEIQRTGRQNVEMHQMSAEQLDFPDASFDSVLCGFALWFFPQPHHTLQEFFRVLKPGGRVGLTTWAEDCPFLMWIRQEMRNSLPPQAPQLAGGQEAPSFDTPAKLETALQQTGFEGIQISMEEHDYVYSIEEEWWLSLWSGGLRSRFEQLEAPELEKFKADIFRKVQVMKQPDGIHTVWRALFALAQKPS